MHTWALQPEIALHLPRARLSGPIRPANVSCNERTRTMTGVGDKTGTLEALLVRVAAADAAAFAEFYDLTRSRAYGMVLRVLRDPGYSEETLQEVYLQVWRTASGFDRSQGSALAWLITLAHRRAVDRVRAEQSGAERESRYGALSTATEFDTVSDEALRRDDTRQVLDCLGSLTDLQRQSVELAYYSGLTYREVSERLSATLPTVKSRIRDGLIRLKNCLGVNSDDA